MEADFWLDRWQQGRTGWQERQPGAMLVRHFGALGLGPGALVLVPLCGATPDIGWLRAQGCAVVGAELSGLAIAQVFAGLGLVPQTTDMGRMRRHSAPGLDLFEGDIFDLTPEMLGKVDAIHDRAALFALPPDIRRRYAAHLVALTGGAPQLLTCFDHGGDPDDGPPFSVPPEEVARLYGDSYRITLLDEQDTGLRTTGAGERDCLWHLADGTNGSVRE